MGHQNPNSNSGESQAILELSWINPPPGIEPASTELLIPVTPGSKISDYLEHIYMKTAECAKIPENETYVFQPEMIQFLYKDTLLTSDEYNTCVDYFTNGKVKLGLNTLHCGTLIARVIDFDVDGIPRPLCALELNYGTDTFETMVQGIEELVKRLGTQPAKTPNYIFTESKLLVHPGMTRDELKDIPVRGQISQFQEIRVKDRTKSTEIGVTVQKLWEETLTVFLETSFTVEKTKEALECLEFGIEANEQRLICDGIELDDDEKLLNHYDHVKDGSIIMLEKVEAFSYAFRYGTADDSFADLTGEIENIPNGKKKYEKPSKGLNIQGLCVNEECKVCREKIKVLVPWPRSTFDLIADAREVKCPECADTIKLQSPVFHLTQWKFYGRKSVGMAEDSDPDAETIEIENTNSSNSKPELLSCEWEIADDPESLMGFNVVDLPGMKLGLTDWEALVILTQPLAKKKERTAKLDFLKFGFGFSLPGLFGINFNFNRLKAFD